MEESTASTSSSSQAFDKTVLGNAPFLSLSSLHTITSTLLENHKSEVNHRWMLPVYDAQIFLLRQLGEFNLGSVSKRILSECELCFSCFTILYVLQVIMTYLSYHNYESSVVTNMIDHSNFLSV